MEFIPVAFCNKNVCVNVSRLTVSEFKDILVIFLTIFLHNLKIIVTSFVLDKG